MPRTQDLNYWKWRVFWGVSVTYGAFYLCRLNISIALPEISRGLGYSKTELGAIGSAFFLFYSVGQMVNGHLGDRVSPRALMLAGLAVSACLNILFGLSSSIFLFIPLWAANGYFQSMGWGPSVRILVHWFHAGEYGRVSGLQAALYQSGNIAAWIMAGILVRVVGWREAFFVPAAILLLFGLYFRRQVRDTPQEAGLLPPENSFERNGSILSDFKRSLRNRSILRVAVAFFWLSIVSYGLLFWLPTYLFAARGGSISSASLRSVMLPFSGIIGGFLATWIIDRFFSARRVPPVVISLLLALPFILAFSYLNEKGLGLFCLFFIGVLVYGPHVVMTGTMPMDYGGRQAASASAGFVDSLGYAGAAVGSLAIGFIADHFQWQAVFWFLGLCVLLSSLFLLPMWRHISKEKSFDQEPDEIPG